MGTLTSNSFRDAAELAVAPEPAQQALAIHPLSSRRPGEPGRSAPFTFDITPATAQPDAGHNETVQSRAERPSAVPFGAIVSGRQKLSLGEIGWWRILLAVVIYAALLFAHPYLFGVNPLG